MRFEAQTIALSDRKGDTHGRNTMVGLWEDGTPIGLASHQCPSAYDNGTPKMQSWYGLTHLTSGISIGADEDVEDEAVARRWLELVAPLLTWTHPAETFTSQGSYLRERAEEGCQQARKGWEQQGKGV